MLNGPARDRDRRGRRALAAPRGGRAVPRAAAGVPRDAPPAGSTLRATTSVWNPRPTGPSRSCRTVSARPAPPACSSVRASTPIHSPRGWRCRWTCRSALMNSQSPKGSEALMPLPKSALAARRASGLAGSSSTSGWRRRCQTRPGPGAHGSLSQRISIAVAAKLASSTSGFSANRISRPSSRPGHALRGERAVGQLGQLGGIACTRSALARQISCSPSDPSSAYSSAASSCTRRPGRTVRVSTRQRRERDRAQELEAEPGDVRALRPARDARARARSAPRARRRAARAGPTARAPARVGMKAPARGREDRARVTPAQLGAGSWSTGSEATKSASRPGSRSGAPCPKQVSRGRSSASRRAEARLRGGSAREDVGRLVQAPAAGAHVHVVQHVAEDQHAVGFAPVGDLARASGRGSRAR